ncbi:hypothetical protein [Streptomyces sp. NPDC004589]|uniref:hypothetical protein n=1 Tax=Streptomyces sp. NPDC004589 TaxID=3154553 RepID=UPI0033B971B8
MNDYNLNPDTPVVVRFAHWANGVAHGDLGRTVTGGEVNDEFGRRIGVSTRLLLIATILGSIGGVLVVAWGAIRQYRMSDRVTTLASFSVLAMPVFVIAVTFKLWAIDINDAVGRKVIDRPLTNHDISEHTDDFERRWQSLTQHHANTHQ